MPYRTRFASRCTRPRNANGHAEKRPSTQPTILKPEEIAPELNKNGDFNYSFTRRKTFK
ncbi:MAG: hypothetical protein WBA41_11800 [Rivularia sp. (in: cyanobacteria)]